MQYLIFELRSWIALIKSRGKPAEIFTYLKLEYYNQLGGQFQFQNRCTSGEIQINVFPVLPDNKNDRNFTEMNNLLVCSNSLPGKIESINMKMIDVNMYGRSANL